MNHKTYSFSHIPQFSDFDQRYAADDPIFKELLPHSPDMDSFKKALEIRKKAPSYRELIAAALEKQYNEAGIINRAPLINKLKSKDTYTVCTAHQLNLFSGPLYVIYKIATAINLAQQVQQKLPEINCIPVYVLGTEDHDFEEINHAHIFRHTLKWEGNDTLAAGQLTTEGLTPVIKELNAILGDHPHAKDLTEIITTAFSKQRSYARGVQKLFDQLFSDYDLIILDMYEQSFKKEFKDLFIADITEGWSARESEQQITKMEISGLKIQAPPRPQNTFYLDKQGRHRIERDQDNFTVADSTIYKWTKEEIIQEINDHPERFSPNVILRPMFQERILPNLAFIGGGGELAYWIELPDLFNNADIPFPILLRRKSYHFLDQRSIEKMEQLGLEFSDLFQPVDDTIKMYLHKHSDVDLSIPEEKKEILNQLDAVIARAEKIDPTLGKSLLAEKKRWEKNLDQLESRLIRSEKSRMDNQVKQIRKLVDRQFPAGKLQERHDNFIPYYLQYGPELIHMIVRYSDPLDKAVSVISESAKISV